MPRYFGTQETASWRCRYKQHYVCFTYRYCWKHDHTEICSICGKKGRAVGIDCRVPKKRDDKGWAKLDRLVNIEHIWFQILDCESMACHTHLKPGFEYTQSEHQCHQSLKEKKE